MFSPSSFAFRPGKSAKKAVAQVCAWIQEGKPAVFRSDIDHYFNSIDHSLLFEKLSSDCDDAFMRLIQESIRLPEVRDGLPIRREIGLCQGSPLSPVLSNLYLHSFDQAMAAHSNAYLRYCDDFVCLENSAEDATALQKIAQGALSEVRLALKQKKTFIGNVADGFSFLGYVFSDQGSIAAVQALESLEDRLEPCLGRMREAFLRDIQEGYSDLEPNWHEAADILRGWQQYYALPPSAYRRAAFAAAALALAVTDADYDAARHVLREEWLDDWAESAHWPLIAELCRLLGHPLLAVRLYEIWFGWRGPEDRDADRAEALYPLWRAYYATSNHLWLTELTQAYADIGVYAFADSLYQQSILAYDAERPSETAREETSEGSAEPSNENDQTSSKESGSEGPLPATPDMAYRMMELFIDNKSYYGQEEIRIGHDRAVQHIAQPLSAEMIQSHLRGECAVSTSFVDDANMVTCMALDIDILSKWLADATVDFDLKKREALRVAEALLKQAAQLGLRALLEDSGQRGFHIWIPIEGEITVAEAAEMTLLLVEGQTDLTGKGIGVERFPSAKRVRSDQTIKLLRLPCGRHPITGLWCPLIETDGTPVRNPVAAFQSFRPTSARHIQIVLRHALAAPRPPIAVEAETDAADLIPLDAGIDSVLRGCAIIRNLCAQARNTGFLRHDERMHLLYVFGHMGEIGRQYLHQVMKWTYNYRYEITQRFISRILDRPIGCNRLREVYADRPFVARCDCDFPMVEGTYPSPVLHAMAKEADQRVTLPRRRHIAEDALVDTSNAFQTHSQLLAMAEQMLTLNKEKNRLEDEIKECQQKLAVLFDRLKVDRFEIGIGTLVRERQGNGEFRWRVEIL